MMLNNNNACTLQPQQSMVQVAIKKENGAATVHKEAFEDFAKNSFMVTISRVQQIALKKAGAKLPTPKEQLEMVNKRREAKKSRCGAVSHSYD